MEGYMLFKGPLKELLRLGPKGLPDFIVLQQGFTQLHRDHKCFRVGGRLLDENQVWKKCYDVADACKTCLKQLRESAKIVKQRRQKLDKDWYHI